MSLFLFNFKFNKMSIEIKTEEVTKVIEKKMIVGEVSYYNSDTYLNRIDDVLRTARVEARAVRVEGYVPNIEKNLLGWGCHSVKPSVFKQILKKLKKKENKETIKAEGNCDISLTPLVNVVRVNSQGRISVIKEELIEKMETLLKIHEFLYKKEK